MAAGRGAAAVTHLNSETAEANNLTAHLPPDLKPQPPTSAPSGRPKGALGREASSSDAAQQMWRGIFQEIAGDEKPMTQEDCAKCAALAAMFQVVSSEVVSVCLSAGLHEGKVRSALQQNMFKAAPNPQDGAIACLEEGKGGSKKVPPCGATSSKGKVDVQAAEGNRISLAPSVKREHNVMHFKHLQGDPAQIYDLGHQVGEGSYGSVRKARHRQTGQIHAVKSVPKHLIEEGQLQGEIAIMKQLDHPHIMRLYYTFEDEKFIYMASEMCAGGELYDTLDETGFFPERVAANLMRQILGAVNYLHSSKSIAHRDLKPENFLVLKRVEHEMIHLKLIDFGTAKRFDQNPLKTKVCTAHYVAPEVLKRGDVEYSEKVDVWSSGVILYMLLCGFMPFHHDDGKEILKLVKKGKYSFSPAAVWNKISDAAKDLIRHMMCVKVEDRYCATQAYNHHWTQSQEGYASADGLQPDDDIVKSMRQFLTNNRLKRIALQIIARQISDDGITKLRNIFLKIDTDHSGTLTLQEIDEALVALDVNEQSRQEMKVIMRSIDMDGSGELEYTEFLAAMLTQEQYLQEDICRGAFCLLDVDGDGTLSNTDLQSLLNTEESEVSLSKAAMEEINTIMAETDANGDGGVSFEEFWALMKDVGPEVKSAAVSLRWQRGKKEAVTNIDGMDLGEDEGDV